MDHISIGSGNHRPVSDVLGRTASRVAVAPSRGQTRGEKERSDLFRFGFKAYGSSGWSSAVTLPRSPPSAAWITATSPRRRTAVAGPATGWVTVLHAGHRPLGLMSVRPAATSLSSKSFTA